MFHVLRFGTDFTTEGGLGPLSLCGTLRAMKAHVAGYLHMPCIVFISVVHCTARVCGGGGRSPDWGLGAFCGGEVRHARGPRLHLSSSSRPSSRSAFQVAPAVVLFSFPVAIPGHLVLWLVPGIAS